MVVLKAAA